MPRRVVCCDGCTKPARENAHETLEKVKKNLKESPAGSSDAPEQPAPAAKKADPEAKIQAALAKLSEADRAIAQKQRFCVVLPKSRLGSMGTPVKVEIKGKAVFLCCEGCRKTALADPEGALKKAEELRKPKSE
jgi:hypothetical protein